MDSVRDPSKVTSQCRSSPKLSSCCPRVVVRMAYLGDGAFSSWQVSISKLLNHCCLVSCQTSSATIGFIILFGLDFGSHVSILSWPRHDVTPADNGQSDKIYLTLYSWRDRLGLKWSSCDARLRRCRPCFKRGITSSLVVSSSNWSPSGSPLRGWRCGLYQISCPRILESRHAAQPYLEARHYPCLWHWGALKGMHDQLPKSWKYWRESDEWRNILAKDEGQYVSVERYFGTETIFVTGKASKNTTSFKL